MKKTIIKILSVILIIATFIPSFSFLAFAEETVTETQTETHEEVTISNDETVEPSILTENILSFSCHYTPSTKTVNIKGTIDYDAFASHGESTIVIYSIPAGMSEHDIMSDESFKPIAEAPISITFAFSFKISSIEERHARYAVFLRTADEKYILTTEPQYAETEQTATSITDKSSFKGFSGNYISDISNSNAKTAIIPVYLDSIFSEESSGYVYQLEKEQFFFNEAYINELDSQIRSLSLFGTKVYLQFLLKRGLMFPSFANDVAKFALPDTSSTKTLYMLHAVTDFLASRYSKREFGTINGIVLGKSWDNAPKYNSIKNISLEKYIFLCGNYAATVANASRDVNPDLNITLPFSGNGFFLEQAENANSDTPLSSRELITILMDYFDKSSYSGLNCSILIETDETPLEITPEDAINGIDLKRELSKNKFYIGNQKVISDFLSSLSEKYKSANKYYSILWTPKKELHGNALSAAYSYAFYALLLDESVINLTIEFSSSANNIENFFDISRLFKHIDSSESSSVTQSALKAFNSSNWESIFKTDSIPDINTISFYNAPVLQDLPKKIKGEFSYFDFSQAFMSENWIKGVGVNEIKIDYLFSEDKALRNNLSLKNNGFSELIYYYEYPENISYTPYISFDIEITSEKSSSAYEINFTFKGKDSIIESSAIIKENRSNTIILDMSNTNGLSSIESVKISVRCLDEPPESSTLWIKNIKGYSKKYSDKELNTLIEKARDEQKHINDYDKDQTFLQRYIFVIVITAASAILGFILIFIIQKNSHSRRKE